MARPLYRQFDEALVAEAVAAVSREELWTNLTTLGSLRRESGSADEWRAARFVAQRLESWGVTPTILEPELYLSSPRRASLRVLGPDPLDIPCKAAAFSRAGSLEATLVHLPYEKDRQKDLRAAGPDLRGQVVLTEKLFMPPKVMALDRLGAVGQIYAKPGETLHEQGASAVWGNPTPLAMELLPKGPVVSIRNSDGVRLAARCRSGPVRVRIETELDEGWVKCPLVVAEIAPEGARRDFLLVHAHLDSWHYGVGDNATGDAAVMELARVFQLHRAKLRHRLRVAWWPAHFKGHYAGSTWYADQFALELYESCFAHVDVDSPGCRWATDFTEHVVWMKEAEVIGREAILAVTGQHAPGARPLRAGDFSFNQIGVTGLMKMLSNIPAAVRRERGFHYFVGGCGGNPVWHTEQDTLETADPEFLQRDTRIYAHAVARLLSSTVHPLDYAQTSRELEGFLEDYQREAGGAFDLGPALAAARELTKTLERLGEAADALVQCAPSTQRDARAIRLNRVLLGVARLLVPIDHAEGERFHHDLGVPLWPLPRLAGVKKLAAAAPDAGKRLALQTLLTRQRNAVVLALRQATELAREFLG